MGYRRALAQFREICGDKDVAIYTIDDCWTFRNWLGDTKDEKKSQPLAGQTKNNKLSAVSSLFWFAIERRYRNDNPMRDVKYYSKNENRKKCRRLYTEHELARLFVAGQRQKEWQYWVHCSVFMLVCAFAKRCSFGPLMYPIILVLGTSLSSQAGGNA